jgi:hypothetical protein
MNVPSSPTVITERMTQLSSLELFRLGFSTLDIARSKGQPESKIYNWIALAKEREREQIEQLRAIK